MSEPAPDRRHCSRCPLPATSPLVTLDRDGECNFCHHHRPVELAREGELTTLLEDARNPRGRYDCIVNISGGRVSAFTLLKVAKDYRMRVLAVNYANPFTDETARLNIDRMVKKLGVELVQFNFRRQLHERILRNNILAWFRNPSPAMVPVICIGCKIIWPRILRIARHHRIRCIINGGNPYEYTSFKKELLGVASGSDLVTSYSRNIFGLLKEGFRNWRYLNPRYLPQTVLGYLFGNQYAPGSRLYGGDIKRIDLFHYIPWREEEVIDRIRAELDWECPADANSSWRFDCRIGHLKDFMYLKTLGMTEKDDFYAKLVREGEVERTEALRRLEVENRIRYDHITDLLRQVNVPVGILDTLG